MWYSDKGRPLLFKGVFLQNIIIYKHTSLIAPMECIRNNYWLIVEGNEDFLISGIKMFSMACNSITLFVGLWMCAAYPVKEKLLSINPPALAPPPLPFQLIVNPKMYELINWKEVLSKVLSNIQLHFLSKQWIQYWIHYRFSQGFVSKMKA